MCIATKFHVEIREAVIAFDISTSYDRIGRYIYIYEYVCIANIRTATENERFSSGLYRYSSFHYIRVVLTQKIYTHTHNRAAPTTISPARKSQLSLIFCTYDVGSMRVYVVKISSTGKTAFYTPRKICDIYMLIMLFWLKGSYGKHGSVDCTTLLWLCSSRELVENSVCIRSVWFSLLLFSRVYFTCESLFYKPTRIRYFRIFIRVRFLLWPNG